MEETTPKKNRKWVIRTAVIFLIIMGLLVFFSQTIMNYSLPKVSAQYPGYGTIATSNKATGIIEAASKTDVKAFADRKIKEVFIYEYYEVMAGDVLMTLEPVTDMTAINDLKNQLEQIELDRHYASELPDDSPDYTSFEDAIDGAQTALDQANLDLTNAQNKTTIVSTAQTAKTAAKTAITSLTAEIDALSNTKADLEIELTDATTVLADAQAVVDGINEALATVQLKIDTKTNEKTALEAELATAQATLAAVQANVDATQEELDAAQADVDRITTAIADIQSGTDGIDEKTLEKADLEIQLTAAKAVLAAAQSEVDRITAEIKTADTKLTSKSASLVSEEAKLDAAETKLTESETYLTVTVAEKNLTKAKKTLQDAKDALSDQKKIDGVDSEKEDKAREDEDKLIAELETKIATIEEQNAINEIKAPVSGLPTGFSFAPGDTITKDQYLGTITDPQGGFKASFTFKATETQTMYIGMDLGVNQYTADRVTVTQIRPDPSDPSGSRIVTAAVEGEYLWAGSEIQVWFDDFNKQYECLVPNSAIHEDNEGKFVYVLKTKSSPLGERYTAMKVSVTILATDGKSSALEPAAIGGQYIITRSEKPLENGEQVRLENYQQEV